MDIAESLSRAVREKVDGVIASPNQLGYRARIDLSVGPDGFLGYLKPRSHEHYRITAEPLARPEIQAWLPKLMDIDLSGLGRVELRSDGQRVIANARSPQKGKGRRAKPELALRIPMPDVALDGKTVRGDPKLRLSVDGVDLQISPGSFYQVNLELNELLVQRVHAMISALAPAHLLDLYAGIGNLSLPSVQDGVQATLVERSGSSTRDARATIKRLGLNAKILERDAGKLEEGQIFADVVMLDPPRAGARGVLKKLCVGRPRAILYVSCNPLTMSRDMGEARSAGYRVTQLWGLEMFPGTEHFEALALLER